MNLHEYQSKQLFARYGIPVPTGFVASTPEEAADAAKRLIGGGVWVVKAQVHAGGRGKAGGVKGVVKPPLRRRYPQPRACSASDSTTKQSGTRRPADQPGLRRDGSKRENDIPEPAY